MGALLHALTGRLPLRVVLDGGGRPFLERYYVGRLGSCRAYVHRFVASDPGGAVHDHPWERALSAVLDGWYIEVRRGRPAALVFWFNWIGGDRFHRVVLPDSVTECWTLFVHGRRAKPWGFWTEMESGGCAVWKERRSEDGEETAWWLTAPQARFEPRRAPPGNPRS